MNFKSIPSQTSAAIYMAQDGFLLSQVEDMVDLLGNAEYQGFSCILIHQKDLDPNFFDLKTGLAGEMLQKCSNYRKKIGIIGNFGEFKSNALRDFIRECNRHRQIVFAPDSEAALALLFQK